MAEQTIETTPSQSRDHKEDLYTAKPWQLIWRRFSKHVLAVVSMWFLVILALCALFAEQVAPYDPFEVERLRTLAPPTPIHFFQDGRFTGPFVYGLSRERDPETARVIYETDTETVLPIRLFHAGDDYSFFGLFETNIHLFGVEGRREYVNLLGTDDLGRDVFSRLIHGARVTLSAGLIGVAFAFILGLTLGSISGYFGGWIDSSIQRLMEFIRSIPTIPLWMGLAAALPIAWDPIFVYVLITLILALIGWTHLARVVRGQFFAIRNEDYVMAARLAGASEYRIITKHMLPSMTSYIIAALTLAVPEMILGETALSFLGLGLRPPVVSWGVLLQDAQNLRSISLAPWLLSPGIAVVLTVLAFNFLGDGLRDAADPYGQ